MYHINTSPLYGCGKRYDLESYLVKNYDESQPLIKQINKQTLARLEKMPEISRKNFLLYILLVQKSIEREKQTNGQRSKDRTYRNEISNRKRRMLSYLKNEIAERKTLENQQNKRLK